MPHLLTALITAFAITASAYSDAGIIYVNAAATGANDGTSWRDAFADLQDALAIAGFGDQIWIAAGTYRPGPPDGGLDETFMLVSGVVLYGGFGGWETSADERDWRRHETVLTGDLAGDGSIHVYHVVTGVSLQAGTLIDGFVIRDGRAWGSGTQRDGGGLRLSDSILTVSNCGFIDNYATNGGGAIYSANSDMLITDSRFILNNAAVLGGGAIYADNGTVTLVACEFVDNLASKTTLGGAIRTGSNASLTVNECAFIDNRAGSGAAIAAGGSSTVIADSTFSGGLSNFGGSAMSWGGGSVHIANSTFEGNLGSPAMYGGSADLTMVDSLVRQNSGGILLWHPGDAAITITGSEFIQNSYTYTGGVSIHAATGDVEVADCIFLSNSRFWRGGGLQIETTGQATVSNTRFGGNSSTEGGGGLAATGTGHTRVINCLIDFNGGALGGGGALAVNGSLDIIGCRVLANGASGLQALNGAELKVINSLIDANHAAGVTVGHAVFGGGAATAEIINSTIINTVISSPKSQAGVRVLDDSHATIRNSILWNNGSGTESDQIKGSADVSHSIVQGFQAGGAYSGPAVSGDDPLFADEDGRLSKDSPAIDAGLNEFLPPGPPSDTDLDGKPRIVDGLGDGEKIVDMGAFEFQPPAPGIPGDLNGDGVVDEADLLILLDAWGDCADCDDVRDCPADFNEDCTVDVLDLLFLLDNWG
jgi:predicted outer membrane repeat protein